MRVRWCVCGRACAMTCIPEGFVDKGGGVEVEHDVVADGDLEPRGQEFGHLTHGDGRDVVFNRLVAWCPVKN